MQAGVTAIERKRDLVSIRFRQDAPIDPAKLASFVSSQRGAQFLPDGTLKFQAKGRMRESFWNNCKRSWQIYLKIARRRWLDTSCQNGAADRR